MKESDRFGSKTTFDRYLSPGLLIIRANFLNIFTENMEIRKFCRFGNFLQHTRLLTALEVCEIIFIMLYD